MFWPMSRLQPRHAFLGALAGLCLALGCAGAPSSPSPSPSPAVEAEAEAEAEAAPAPLEDRDPALACRLVREEGAVLLDVRTAEEFAEGHVDGAVNIPHDEIGAREAEVDALQGGEKDRAIVVYCRSGRRSGIAKQTLIESGRTQVSNLGGVDDWAECK